MAQVHPFDLAIALAPQGENSYTGHTSPAYWNMVGPFGGISAGTMLNAVMQHPARLGEPVSLTINYASGLVQGPFGVSARPARTNRSTQHWMLEMVQVNQAGIEETVLTATVLTAARRSTWGTSESPMPAVPPARHMPVQAGFSKMEWLKRYDIRAVAGAMPRTWDGALHPEGSSLTQLWMRDEPPRPLDFCALAAYADIFYPRLYLRRASAVPVGTVSMTVYFHAGTALLQQCGDTPVLGQARGQMFRDGFFDQSAQLWSGSGDLLVTSSQIVYYKE